MLGVFFNRSLPRFLRQGLSSYSEPMIQLGCSRDLSVCLCLLRASLVQTSKFQTSKCYFMRSHLKHQETDIKCISQDSELRSSCSCTRCFTDQAISPVSETWIGSLRVYQKNNQSMIMWNREEQEGNCSSVSLETGMVPPVILALGRWRQCRVYGSRHSCYIVSGNSRISWGV